MNRMTKWKLRVKLMYGLMNGTCESIIDGWSEMLRWVGNGGLDVADGIN